MRNAGYHLGLVGTAVNLTYKVWNKYYERREVESVGFIYLVKAIEKFDESLGYKFSTFAIPIIRYGICVTIRDDKSIFRRRGELLKITSLNSFVNGMDNEVEYQELISDGIDYEDLSLNNILVSSLLERLTNKERQVIQLYYFDSLSQVEISKMLSISQAHISRILKQSINKMRRVLDVAS